MRDGEAPFFLSRGQIDLSILVMMEVGPVPGGIQMGPPGGYSLSALHGHVECWSSSLGRWVLQHGKLTWLRDLWLVIHPVDLTLMRRSVCCRPTQEHECLDFSL